MEDGLGAMSAIISMCKRQASSDGTSLAVAALLRGNSHSAVTLYRLPASRAWMEVSSSRKQRSNSARFSPCFCWQAGADCARR